MALVRNERTKLLAGNFDRLSSAFAIMGVVTPVVAWSYKVPTAPALTFDNLAFSGVWLLAAVALHILASRLLRSLEE